MGIIAQFFAPFHPRRITSLVRTRDPESERQRETEQDAAADVAAVQQDDKYFGTDRPADQDELLSPAQAEYFSPERDHAAQRSAHEPLLACACLGIDPKRWRSRRIRRGLNRCQRAEPVAIGRLGTGAGSRTWPIPRT